MVSDKVAKFLGKKGKELAYSNSKFERILDKYQHLHLDLEVKNHKKLFEAEHESSTGQ